MSRIVVVDNGSDIPIRSADFPPGQPVDVVRLPVNRGSAPGFHAGISAARALDNCRFVILLDDDNVGDPGFIDRLLALHLALGSSDTVGLCALRRSRGLYPKLLAEPNTPAIRANSFMSFHLLALPAKIRDAVVRRPSSAPPDSLRLRRIETAPYGGLMLPIAVVRSAAPPDERFVLYSDDHDYSLRLLDAGVTLYLTDVGCITDIEQSWDQPRRRARRSLISFDTPPWRIYYAARNRMMIERRFVTSPVIYRLNRLAYLAILAIDALGTTGSLSGMRAALDPLRRGIADGDSGRLGAATDFPLPTSAQVRPASAEVLPFRQSHVDHSVER